MGGVGTNRRSSRRLGLGALVLAGAALLVVAAWVASNWHDAAPQPRPARLTLPAPTLADDANAFFALLALKAPADRDLADSGRRIWQAHAAYDAHPPLQRTIAAAQARNDAERQARGGDPLAWVFGLHANCASEAPDCIDAVLADPRALAARRDAASKVVRMRCERLLAADIRFEERLPPRLDLGASFAVHASGAGACSQWLLADAVLAFAAGDRAHALAQLRRADRLHRALLAGSRSLVGQVVAWGRARDGLRVVAALGVRDAALAADLAPLAAPWPDLGAATRRWIAVESAVQQAALRDLSAGCGTRAVAATDRDEPPLFVVPTSGLLKWLECHHIGWHPERSSQALDAQWERRLDTLDAGGPPGLAAAWQHESAVAAPDVGWTALAWRNTIGQLLIDIARPAFGDYFERHADLELHREAVALALAAQAAGVPAAQRAAWAQGQPLSATARERLAWSGDGATLAARTWSPANADDPRRAVRVTWPARR